MNSTDLAPQLPETNPPALPPSTSLIGRMLNVFAAPGDVFEEVKASPPSTANWLAPALLLILLSWLGAGIIFSQDSIQVQLRDATDKQIQKQIDKGRMSKEQADQARELGEKYGAIGSKVSAVAAPVIAAFAIPFWGGLIVWLVGTRAFGGNFTYLKGVEVAGLANMIGVLEAVVKTLLIVVTGNIYASPSLAMLLKEFDPQNMSQVLLGIVNVMTFWALGVRSVGLAKLSGVSFAKAALWIFGIWALLTACMLGIGFAIQAAFANIK